MSTYMFYKTAIDNVYKMEKITPTIKKEIKALYERLRNDFTLEQIDSEIGLKSKEAKELFKKYEDLYLNWFVRK